MKIGFSTGSLALDNVRLGLQLATNHRAKAVELSALREKELDPLLESLDWLENDLKSFEYVSFHAPSKRTHFSESELVEKLRKVADRGWAIIVHPDMIEDFSLWQSLGRAVCIENMDKRKAIGRTAAQIQTIFEKLPEATFCFDIGHARQVDPTMQEAEAFLQCFQDRLRQVHMSYVNSQSRHERLNFESIRAFQRVAHWLSEAIPIILETPVEACDIDDEIKSAESVFAALSRNSESNLGISGEKRWRTKNPCDTTSKIDTNPCIFDCTNGCINSSTPNDDFLTSFLQNLDNAQRARLAELLGATSPLAS